MTEKAFASLSGALLARKGGARPAMRPQLYAASDASAMPEGGDQDDLGWNDHGTDMLTEEQREQLLPAASETALATAELAEAGELPSVEVVTPMRAGDAEDIEDTEIPEVVRQQQALGSSVSPMEEPEGGFTPDGLAEGEEDLPQRPPAKPPIVRTAPPSRTKTAFTLRLDKARHLSLRLAAAHAGESAQAFVTAALDEYIEKHFPEFEARPNET